MRRHGRTRGALAAGVALTLLAPAAAQATVFSFPGSEEPYEAPVGAAAIDIVATGAPGGSGDTGALGGRGSIVRTRLAVTAGQVLYVNVGEP
jgi:hypothetical protein